MIQSFRKCKIDINDSLFSQIIRQGKTRCQRCQKVRSLQCCHIFSRSHYSTRFDFRNACALCADCHNWMDSHKDDTPLFNPDVRKFLSPTKNAFSFLNSIGWKWDELQKIYLKSHQPVKIHYKYWKKEMTKQLREELKRLEMQ